ncbi:MAG: AAA family ATPase [Nostoc sp. DedVER02]|uniref:AAA family ATPase n=1 Tax=unclassified Nostoc TaxID=2593658 RepID=UPI002AD4C82F|nr:MULTISPECIES: AAA family ATPase [unclassified Nostoc]MDZ7987405.1 AAA family ATPase [Nostoc sp. DedVER02]MDZ8116639.1 AAA family ATPase [Nostoc sp. DedVER01b]
MLEIPGYQICTKIYESANSRVYRGINQQKNLPVIFKVLNKDYPTPEEITRYKLEYEITRSLSLKGVVQAYCLQQYQSTFAIILEDFGGEALTNILAKRKFTLTDFLKLAIQITEILSAIHTANIIHKDINPSNIVLNSETKQIKIIDFGISTVLSRETLILKNPTVLEGTLAYISPEQTGRMNRSLDYRTDFYSLGVTFYQLLTHQLPFESSDALELIHYHLALEPVPPHLIDPGIPVMVSEIVLKLLAKTAENRYQSAWGIKTDLEDCLKQLQHRGKIEYFLLGQQDISDKFYIPEKLYGRERQVEILLAAFERVAGKDNANLTGSTSQVEVMLIAGYSGIGKSVLVQEIYKPITQQRGYFVSGKFDQYQRNIPYFAIAQALESLIEQLLTEDEVHLSQWRENLLAVLGSNSRVITQVIPALELIVGNQPEVPVLPPTEAQNRFHQVFQNFIRVFTQSEHPLVIFLDDLQWADNASLKLLQLLATATKGQSLLLMGAYRYNEVNAAHPLIQMVEEIRQGGGVVNELSLLPLSLPDINQFMADTLHCQSEDCLSLAELVQRKTGGNPFFMNEFLKSLYTEGLLKFNCQTKKWQWSIEQIQEREITDNIVDLMAGKIQKLNKNTQEVLQVAACIGNSFDLETLALTAQLSQRETVQALAVAIAQGLILPLSNAHKSVELDVPLPSDRPAIEYKFIHDRIQQAAYSLIAEAEQSQIHWQVGQCLLQITPAEHLKNQIFDITNQLNLGKKLLKTQSEQDNLSRLNLMAGEKAKASAAYDAAWKYLQTGLDLLTTDSWQTNYDFTLTLYSATTEAAYLSGNFEQVEPLFQQVINHAKTLLTSLKVYDVKIQTRVAQSQLLEAIQIGLQLLQQLGIHLPIQPTFEDVQQALSKTASKLANRRIEDLVDLPMMSEPEVLAAMQLLTSMCASAYLAVPPLFLLVVLKMVDLLVEYGNMMLAPFAYAAYGIILCGVVFDIEAGYQFGQLALSLLDRLDAKPIQARTLFAVSNQINVWKTHLKYSLKPLQNCSQVGVEQGDFEFAGYAAMYFCGYSFAVGQPLAELQLHLTSYAQAVKQIKHSAGIHFVKICWQTVLNLVQEVPNPGMLSGQAYDEATRLPQMQQTNFHGGLFFFYLNKLFLCYLFEDANQAISNAVLAQEYLPAMTGAALVGIFHFYDSLCRLAVYSNTDVANQFQLLEQVAENQAKMKNWAHHAPTNYLHKWHLVEAERHRVLGEVVEAMDAYDRAIALARENEYLQEESLANELAAKFHLANNRITIAKAYLQEARYGYLRWGATAKVQDLERRYPQLLEVRSPRSETRKFNPTESAFSNLETLDLETVLKASHAIASEILLDKLLAKLMTILIENAGAQTGYLILPTQEKWRIEAMGTIGDQKVAVLQSIPLESRSQDSTPYLPTSLINYVVRTKETVVLNNATQFGNFQSEPWIVQRQSKSILCAPLLNQGKLTGIVLLENNLSTRAFTPERIEILHLLFTQAAISIDNARLLKQEAELNQSLRAEIAERQRVEKDRDRMIAILEASTDYIGMATPQGNVLWNNTQFRKLLDVSLDVDLSNLSIANYHPQWALEIIQNQGIPLAIRDGTWVGETALLESNGREIPVSQMIIAHKATDGSLEYLSTMIRDISEAKRREEALKRSETTLQNLVMGTAAVTGKDFFAALVGHIAKALHVRYALVTELVNGKLKALAFWAHGALQPEISYFPARTPCELALRDGLFYCKSFVQQIFPEDLDLVAMQAESYLGISLKNANGEPIGNLCILDIQPLLDTQQIEVILRVFAARAAAELERNRAIEALHQLNQSLEVRVKQRTAELEAANKALEAFSYSVSHDLRAPLRAIVGFSRMMQEDYSEQLDAEGNRYLKIVRDNAKRMGELIDDLLNLSRLDRKEMSQRPIFINEMIQKVLSDLAPDLEGREIEFAIADLPNCQADPSLLKQVWINLLSNAIKYTRYKSPACIEVGYEIMNGEGVYFIRDNGAGFDMRYADNLFGVFQRLHREQEFAGTGIGLAIVQRIIQRHSGRIWAEAAIDRGATFYFTLQGSINP